jgi:hypothetical protein
MQQQEQQPTRVEFCVWVLFFPVSLIYIFIFFFLIFASPSLLISSEVMAVVLWRVVVLGVEGHRIGRRSMHHGRRRCCSSVHHVTHTAAIGTVSAARASRIQSHYIFEKKKNKM